MATRFQKIQLVRDALHRGMAHQEVDRIERIDKLQDGLRIRLDDGTVMLVEITVHRSAVDDREAAFVEGFDEGRPSTDVLGSMRERTQRVSKHPSEWTKDDADTVDAEIVDDDEGRVQPEKG